MANDVPALIDRWVAAGIITPDQAERLRADAATLAPRRAVSLVAEGLGYLGGVIVVVGLGLLLGLTWAHVTPGGRIGIVGGVAAALLAAGALIPAKRLGTTGPRLRGVLWLVAVAALFGALGMLSEEVLDRTEPSTILLVASVGSGVVSAALWALNRHVLQQLSTVVPVLIAANNATAMATDSDFLAAVAVWAVGLVWFALSLAGIIPAVSGGVLGALGAIVGAIMMLGEEWGPLIAVTTTLVLVVVAVLRRELPLLGVSSVGTLIVLPFAVDEYLPGGTLATAISLVVGGLALVAVGVLTARRRRSPADA